jgi:hypothetical protein
MFDKKWMMDRLTSRQTIGHWESNLDLGRQVSEKKLDHLLEENSQLRALLIDCYLSLREVLHQDCPQCKQEAGIMLKILERRREMGYF